MMLDSAAEFDVRDYLRAEMMPHFLCPGCGHGIALRALLWAVHELGIDKDKLAVVSGIGCAGRLSAYIDANTFHVTHGRPIAYATGLALARPDLHVVVITGDGDCLAIGGNHLIHACRRNLKLTCLMLNNEVYGMTGGQVSPTTTEMRLTTTTPLGNTEPHFDACALAAAAGAGFVGREVTHHVPKLKELIRAGLEHPGFAFVEVLTDCTEIFGRKNEMGSSPEMMLRQKSDLRPSAYRDSVDTPFRPNNLATGILTRIERPEYGAAYRRAAAAAKAAAAKSSAARSAATPRKGTA
jgi:2-oxoglutarate ferredoxin oxidoreductase subunit beta